MVVFDGIISVTKRNIRKIELNYGGNVKKLTNSIMKFKIIVQNSITDIYKIKQFY